MPVTHVQHKPLRGFSFDIADLVLFKAWSEARNLHMTIRLDHGLDGEEYEEVLAFSRGDSPLTRWIMWRDETVMYVQPIIGRTLCFDSAAQIMEALTPKTRIRVTDIKASNWPK
jgi:hypothetical protein